VYKAIAYKVGRGVAYIWMKGVWGERKKMDDGCLFEVGGVRRLGMLIVFHFQENKLSILRRDIYILI
jgi:hypothetical protein